ncbi:MAG: hypothetical protein RR598_10915 [Anaerorhabdus sp.]
MSLPVLESNIVEQYYNMLSQASSGLFQVDIGKIKTDIALVANDKSVDYYLFCEEVGYVTQFETREEIVDYMIKTNYSNVMFWGLIDQNVKNTLKEWC